MTLVTSTLATFATSTLADESCVGDCVGDVNDGLYAPIQCPPLSSHIRH